MHTSSKSTALLTEDKIEQIQDLSDVDEMLHLGHNMFKITAETVADLELCTQCMESIGNGKVIFVLENQYKKLFKQIARRNKFFSKKVKTESKKEVEEDSKKTEKRSKKEVVIIEEDPPPKKSYSIPPIENTIGKTSKNISETSKNVSETSTEVTISNPSFIPDLISTFRQAYRQQQPSIYTPAAIVYRNQYNNSISQKLISPALLSLSSNTLKDIPRRGVTALPSALDSNSIEKFLSYIHNHSKTSLAIDSCSTVEELYRFYGAAIYFDSNDLIRKVKISIAKCDRFVISVEKLKEVKDVYSKMVRPKFYGHDAVFIDVSQLP